MKVTSAISCAGCMFDVRNEAGGGDYVRLDMVIFNDFLRMSTSYSNDCRWLTVLIMTLDDRLRASYVDVLWIRLDVQYICMAIMSSYDNNVRRWCFLLWEKCVACE